MAAAAGGGGGGGDLQQQPQQASLVVLRVRTPYAATNEKELTCAAGDIVTSMESPDDGEEWIYCTATSSTGSVQEGFVPAEQLQAVPDAEAAVYLKRRELNVAAAAVGVLQSSFSPVRFSVDSGLNTMAASTGSGGGGGGGAESGDGMNGGGSGGGGHSTASHSGMSTPAQQIRRPDFSRPAPHHRAAAATDTAAVAQLSQLLQESRILTQSPSVSKSNVVQSHGSDMADLHEYQLQLSNQTQKSFRVRFGELEHSIAANKRLCLKLKAECAGMYQSADALHSFVSEERERQKVKNMYFQRDLELHRANSAATPTAVNRSGHQSQQQ